MRWKEGEGKGGGRRGGENEVEGGERRGGGVGGEKGEDGGCRSILAVLILNLRIRLQF